VLDYQPINPMQAPRPLAFPQTSLWFTTICSIASLLAFLLTPADAAGPNIIVIVSDDHRHDALGVVQRELGDRANFPFFKSPQLDRLAAGGVRFRNGFVTHSLCSPSRATMLSGLHTHEHGITYFQALAGMDDNVGRVLDVLDELHLAENTLILYMGDNGYYLGEHGLGDKRTAYEQSIRIPYLIRFPAAFKPAVRDELVLNLDAAATILDACGLKPTWKQHGVSLMPLLKARPGSAPWRNSFLYQNYKDPAFPKVTFDVLAVRTKTHKYVENDANPEWTQLFDLTADPSENRNLTGSPGASGILAEMKAELSRLKEQSGFRPPLSQVK
jgi:arylsulfatase A-like enzyme